MTVTLSGVTARGITLHAFAPSSLFAAGEQGAWYDPSDFTTMFQDEAGTTPVTAFEQSVGRILDKSGRGNHATTPAAATTSRPVLSARYNLLTKTEQFDDAVWTKTGFLAFGSGSIANAIAAPDGTTTADLLVENTSNSQHSAQSANVSATSGTSYTLSRYVKSGTGSRWFVLSLSENNTAQIAFVHFQPSTNTLGGIGSSGANWTSVTGSATSVGDGWYRVSLTATLNLTTTISDTSRFKQTDNGTSTYTGDGTSSMYWWGADLRVANDGVGIPTYQYVNTSTSYTTDGFPPYLLFDGVDDYMFTGTITPGTDKAQVFAGVRKLSDATNQMIFELSVESSVNNGTFAYSIGASGANSFWRSRGTLSASGVSSGTPAAPVSLVTTGIGDIAGDVSRLRENTVQTFNSTADQGTGNYLAYPLYIGRRGGTTLPFNGRLYSLIVRFGANLTTDQIVQTETWVNSETKAY